MKGWEKNNIYRTANSNGILPPSTLEGGEGCRNANFNFGMGNKCFCPSVMDAGAGAPTHTLKVHF